MVRWVTGFAMLLIGATCATAASMDGWWISNTGNRMLISGSKVRYVGYGVGGHQTIDGTITAGGNSTYLIPIAGVVRKCVFSGSSFNCENGWRIFTRTKKEKF